MGFGINNVTQVTWDAVQNITNSSASYPELAANVNHSIYGGWLYFIILWVLVIILYVKLQSNRDQPLINLMYTFSITAIIALVLRIIEFTRAGNVTGLITDFQMWIFPILAIVFAAINWAIKDE